MEKELKIVVLIFLTFFIYGITSLFNSGHFVTPFFLNKFILLAISIAFYAMNYRQIGNKLLLFYMPVVFLSVLMDQFSLSFLSQKLDVPGLTTINQNIFVGIAYLLIHFGFFFGFTIYLFSRFRSYLLMLLCSLLMVVTIVLLFVPGYEMIRDLSFFIYLIILIVYINRKSEALNKGVRVLSKQFLLLFLLEVIEYF